MAPALREIPQSVVTAIARERYEVKAAAGGWRKAHWRDLTSEEQGKDESVVRTVLNAAARLGLRLEGTLEEGGQ